MLRHVPRMTTIRLRSFRAGDRSAVTALLPHIGAWYPDGEAWLDRRLGDSLSGRATTQLVFHGGLLAGIAIDTPKGARCHKLSTIYVAPWARRQGIGSVLFRWLYSSWVRLGTTAVYVTVNAAKDDVCSFLEQWGFREQLIVPDRYGPGRSERVLTWNPDLGEELAAHSH